MNELIVKIGDVLTSMVVLNAYTKHIGAVHEVSVRHEVKGPEHTWLVTVDGKNGGFVNEFGCGFVEVPDGINEAAAYYRERIISALSKDDAPYKSTADIMQGTRLLSPLIWSERE